MAAFTELITCQRVTSIMVFLGFAIHHMMRLNITIAIIDMMVSKNNTVNMSQLNVPRFNWNENERNDIMGIFFLGYILTQVPGGRLSEIFGSKRVIGIGLFFASILTILIPFACQNYHWILFVRFAIGLSMGVHWPSTPPMATKWVSSSDTSMFTSHMMACCLGAALTLPLCGYLIHYFGWPSVFYVTGGISLIWTVMWMYLVYDSPQKHPRISKSELEKLTKVIRKDNILNKPTKTPWKRMLTSTAVWALIIANTSVTFTIYIVLFQLPVYVYQVLHLNIKENGWLSSFPYIARYVVAVISSYIADKIIKSEKISVTWIRKSLNAVSFFGTAILFIVQAFWGDNYTICVLVMTGSFAFMGLVSPGILANFVDISPVYCGTVLAITHIPVSLFGYISTKIVAYFTAEEQTFQQWSYIFWIVVGVNFVTVLVCLVFISGEVQSWNYENKEVEMIVVAVEKDELLENPRGQAEK